MPNHCTHRLVINGPQEDVTRLVDLLHDGDSPFSFNSLIPMPEELRGTSSPNGLTGKEMTKKYGHADWYGWAVSNWGTKWNAYEVNMRGVQSPLELLAHAGGDGTREVEYDFQTAWSPPLPFMEKLFAENPTLTFTWYGIEEQPSWGCFILVEGGEIVEGGHCDGSEQVIWSLSDWHDRFRWGEEDEDEDEGAE